MSVISRRTLTILASALLLSATAVQASPDPANDAECEIVFSVDSDRSLASLGWTVDYSAAPGRIAGSGSTPACVNLVPDGMSSFTDDDDGRALLAELAVQPPAENPGELARCLFQGDDVPLASDFDAFATFASDADLQLVDPLPRVEVTSIDCADREKATTAAFTAAQCAANWTVMFRLGTSSKAVSSLQFDVNYASATGGFQGSGSTVSCTKQVLTALFAPMDVEATSMLTMGLVDLDGFSAPKDLVKCTFNGDAGDPPVPGDFLVTIVDSSSAAGDPVASTIQTLVTAEDGTVICPTTCGDGVVSGSEACDDGNAVNTDACLNTCVAARCGDGVVRTGSEACDDGNTTNTDGCLNTCVAAKCGDGVIRTGVETCDDGNTVDNDSCPNTCVTTGQCTQWDVMFRMGTSSGAVSSLQFDVNYASATGGFEGSGSTVKCTKQVVTALFAPNDVEASSTLTLGLVDLDGFSAPKDLAKCTFNGVAGDPPVPGDFVITIVDSTNADGDPVSSTVQASVTAICTGFCGDGVKSTTEACDDGNTSNADACLNNCTLARCGDGVVRTGVEACDDGNTINNDACLNTCVAATCGDGVLRTGVEACDDGNATNTDACLNTCVAARCGDGVLRTGTEACDDGNLLNTDACLDTCVAAKCGDGYLRTGVETCDDGNAVNTDACPATCTPARCGDGYVRSGVEVCDDGNSSNIDACMTTCVAAKCGDGYIRTGVEECDDANVLDQDGCSPVCLAGPLCSDPTGDGRVLVGDVLRILQRGVGLPVECPDWTCDPNGDGRVTAPDALVSLNASVGLPVVWKCPLPSAVVLSVTSVSTLGGLQLDLDYDDVLADLVGDGALVQCQGLVPGALFVFNNKPTRVLSMSMVLIDGFTGPRDIARCKLTPWGIVKKSAFVPKIVDAISPAGTAVSGVQVKAVPY